MYLNKKTYIGNKYRDNNEQIRVVIPENQENSMFPVRGNQIKNERISEITEQVAYWRKANAIHNWFVQNVQDGVDECQEAYVSIEQLKELVDACKKDIEYLNTLQYDLEEEYKEFKDVDESHLTLIPTGGFFFGSTKFDSWLIQDFQNTIDQIEPLLEETGDFYYQSSW